MNAAESLKARQLRLTSEEIRRRRDARGKVWQWVRMSDDNAQESRPSLELGGHAAQEAAEAVARFVAELQAAINHDDADTYDRRLASDVGWGSPYGATVHGYSTLHAIHVRCIASQAARRPPTRARSARSTHRAP